jgi:hypothetical protein
MWRVLIAYIPFALPFPPAWRLIDEQVDPLVSRGLRDCDAITVSYDADKQFNFNGGELDFWVCGGELYGDYGQFHNPRHLDRVNWRRKDKAK